MAQLVNKSRGIKTERIPCKNARLQAQILVFPTRRLLWINSYFPNDPLTINYDDQELIDTLLEIENILDTSNFEDCILQGDLN